MGNPGAIIAGTVGAQSTREAIEMCQEAQIAGADYALILPPSYYPAWMTPEAIQGFFEDVRRCVKRGGMSCSDNCRSPTHRRSP